MQIVIGKTYTYKGYSYKVLAIVQMKHPTSRRWKNAVYYERVGNKAQRHHKFSRPPKYVRLASEFVKKFERIKYEKRNESVE